MPRRNLYILLALGVVCLLCYRKVQTNVYGRILAGAIEEIHHRALTEVPRSDLFEGAMQGMVRKLEDPYSGYIAPKSYEEMNEEMEQEFGGVGIMIGLDEQTTRLIVLSPLFRSPACEAGIRAGDLILRIDGRNTQGLSLEESKELMRGAENEPVTLTVRHQGSDQEIPITIVRKIIETETVLGDTRRPDGSWQYFLEGSDRIGYVQINGFGKKTSTELRKVLGDLLERGMKGLILDLRGNPGGLLDAAVEVSDMLIESGTIVTTRGRDKQIIRKEEASQEGTLEPFPVAVLVNRNSASASEIAAACWQDHHRAVIVGERTWGKGTVQEVMELEGNRGALRLTIASYWRPSGKNIHRIRKVGEDDPPHPVSHEAPQPDHSAPPKPRENGDWGVRPDKGYELVLDDEEFVRFRRWRYNRNLNLPLEDEQDEDGNPLEPFVDRQLDLAVDYLRVSRNSKR